MANFAGVVDTLREARARTARELEQLDRAIAALDGLGTRKGMRFAGRKRRTMSAAARRRIAAAQRARWAKWKAKHKKAA